MDISNNNVSGRIPDWIGNFSLLQSLSMSNNLLEAEIPKEICALQSLTYLALAENILSGKLPDCLGGMDSLRFLHLQKNNLTGAILSIPIITLYSLDLRDNKFYGKLPRTLFPVNFDGEIFLRVLLLGGNQLSGSISDELSLLLNVKILDLSRNRFTGTISFHIAKIISTWSPLNGCLEVDDSLNACLETIQSNWTIYEKIAPSYNSTLRLNYNSLDDQYVIIQPLLAEFRTKHNMYPYKGNVLKLMSGLDLSCNELHGSIPPEIGNIRNINVLNLSHNRLSGAIPRSLSNLIQVESLDLSYNNLSGAIPLNLIELRFLEIFNVSYNNLSGPTPTTGQFATFGEDNYRGNPNLFGYLNESSHRTLSPPPPPSETASNEGEENHTAIELVSFYWGFIISYVTVILGLVIILWFSPRWCRVWFRFVDLCIYYCFPCIFRNGFR